MSIKQVNLTPYPGMVLICSTKKEYRKEHKRLFGEDIDLTNHNGRMDGEGSTVTYIAWGKDTPHLVHELLHIAFHVFEKAGIDPRCGDEEPFCYFMTSLVEQSTKDAE